MTYAGDTLIATKVTGFNNVPKGEVTFEVDLSMDSSNILEPIELGEKESGHWGVRFLSRFAGKGQVAGRGFSNPQLVPGQMILVNEYFSFAFAPLKTQIFFGRPSPDLTIKLLRDAERPITDGDKNRRHLERCMEETEHLMDEEYIDDPNEQQTDLYNEEGCFE